MNTSFHPPQIMGKALLAATRDPNMGAGIMCSGASGSGKTNIAEWVFIEYVKNGWPALWFCPHGDAAKYGEGTDYRKSEVDAAGKKGESDHGRDTRGRARKLWDFFSNKSGRDATKKAWQESRDANASVLRS